MLLHVGAQPRPGEIWAFVGDDGEVYVHRCVTRRPGSYRFQGDGEGRADPDVGPERLVGRVSTIETAGRASQPAPAALSRLWWTLRHRERRLRARLRRSAGR